MPGTPTFLEYATLSSKWNSVASPPGFTAVSGGTVKRAVDPVKYDELKSKRAWDLAISPAKTLPMNAFMLYMSGSGVQIFSITSIVMLLFSPFKAISGLEKAFAPFLPTATASSGDPLFLQKTVYMLVNLLPVALALWKCQQMGLIPTGTGDWLAFETRGTAPELSLR
ncbi:DUF1077-domain-containing protein [Calocera cornea HHB12733]|uniref:ER membrane protein complex subunit 4 n=1 Tax=Calocera cornea HHB12733 TaxID=1353952 RepID=A0A165DW86_9BASI|nr:DUF1077-domain-containing protein [Calocera cornea HHB12733]